MSAWERGHPPGIAESPQGPADVTMRKLIDLIQAHVQLLSIANDSPLQLSSLYRSPLVIGLAE